MKKPITLFLSTLAFAGLVTAQTTLVEETFTYAAGDVSVVGTGGTGWDVMEGGWQVGSSTAARRFTVSSGMALYQGDTVNQIPTWQPRTFAAPVSSSATETITISCTLQILETQPGRGIGIEWTLGGVTQFYFGKEVNGAVGLHEKWYNGNSYATFATTGATEPITATLTYDGTDTFIVLSDSDETLAAHTIAGILTIDGISLAGYHKDTTSNGIDDIRVTSALGVPGAPYCFGDGSGTPCPCANNNNGAVGGCDWGNTSFPEGGVLSGTGSNSFAANDAYLHATGIENNFGIFFGANNQVNGGNGNLLNDGLRCAGGGLVRLTPPTMASGNQTTLPAPLQTLDTGAASGGTRRYQYWFRTPGGPCGQMANLTNGYEVVWMP